MNTPDLTKKVLGYRAFNWDGEQLGSVGHLVNILFWCAGENRAKCFVNESHIAPDKSCHCGYNAYHEIPQDWHSRKIIMPITGKYPNVGAAIAGWGKMQVHSDGFRAEKAQIVMLTYDPHIGQKRIKELQETADLYEVRLVTIDLLAREAKQFASPIPASLLPKKPDQRITKAENFRRSEELKAYEEIRKFEEAKESTRTVESPYWGTGLYPNIESERESEKRRLEDVRRKAWEKRAWRYNWTNRTFEE